MTTSTSIINGKINSSSGTRNNSYSSGSGSSSRTLDLSGIEDEAALDAAATTLLPESEKEKLAWTAMTSKNINNGNISETKKSSNRGVRFQMEDDDDNYDDDDDNEGEEDDVNNDEETEISGPLFSRYMSTTGGSSSGSNSSSTGQTSSLSQSSYGAGTSQFFTAWAASIMRTSSSSSSSSALEKSSSSSQQQLGNDIRSKKSKDKGSNDISGRGDISSLSQSNNENGDENDDDENGEDDEDDDDNDLFSTDTIGKEITRMRHALGIPSSSSKSSSRSYNKHTNNTTTTLSLSAHNSLTKLRFDLQGHLVLPQIEFNKRTEDVDTRELYHHGEDSLRPGYTLVELLGLTRSAVAAQRSVAWRTLALLLARRRHAFISPFQPPFSSSSSSSSSINRPPWQYLDSEWPIEARLLRSLLLPPVLPAMLRSAADEISLSCLIPGLDSLLAFAVAPECNGAPLSSSSSSNTNLNRISWNSLSTGWFELSSPAVRPQPPTEDEGDWKRLVARHAHRDAGVDVKRSVEEEEEEEEGGERDEEDEEDQNILNIAVTKSSSSSNNNNSAGMKNQARIALRDGRQALRDPVTILCAEGYGRMDLLQRISVILSNLASIAMSSTSTTSSSSSSLSSSSLSSFSSSTSRNGSPQSTCWNDPPQLRVAQQCVQLLRAAAYRSLSLADTIARRLFVTVPVGRVERSTTVTVDSSQNSSSSSSSHVRVGVLQFLVNAFISPLSINRQGVNVVDGRVGTNGEGVDSRNYKSLSLRHSLAADVVSLIRVIAQQGRGLAADLCDEPDPKAVNAPRQSLDTISGASGSEDEGSWASSSSSFSSRSPGCGLGPPIPVQALARGKGEFGTRAVAEPVLLDSLIHLLPLLKSDQEDLLDKTSSSSPWFGLQIEVFLLIRVCTGYGLATFSTCTLVSKMMMPTVTLWQQQQQEQELDETKSSSSFSSSPSSPPHHHHHLHPLPSRLDIVVWILLDLCASLLSASSAEAEALSKSLPRGASAGSDVAYIVSDCAHLSAQSASLLHQVTSSFSKYWIGMSSLSSSSSKSVRINAASLSISSQVMKLWSAHLSRLAKGG